MADPTLTRTRVTITYASSDKYRAEFTAKAGAGSKHRVTGEEVPPQRALLAALEELARLTALFGFQDEALECFNGARQRVAEWQWRRSGGCINPADFTVSEYPLERTSGWAPRLYGVEVTHTPTGMSERCGDDRSEHRNKAVAYERLVSRLDAASTAQSVDSPAPSN